MTATTRNEKGKSLQQSPLLVAIFRIRSYLRQKVVNHALGILSFEFGRKRNAAAPAKPLFSAAYRSQAMFAVVRLRMNVMWEPKKAQQELRPPKRVNL